MMALGIFMLLLGVAIAAVVVFAFWHIFKKAGLHGAWSLLMLVPLVNIGAVLYLAFAEWPALKGQSAPVAAPAAVAAAPAPTTPAPAPAAAPAAPAPAAEAPVAPVPAAADADVTAPLPATGEPKDEPKI